MGNIYDPVGSLKIAKVESELLDHEIAKRHKVEDDPTPRVVPIVRRASVALGARLTGIVKSAQVGSGHRTGHKPASA
jgi:hypothetical protein